jgi:hypothetical protein
MKRLEKKFSHLKFDFSQICREGDFAIYSRKYSDSEKVHYEVIKVLSHNGYAIGGEIYPPSEYYPSANSWGTDGFTCVTKEDAYKRLEKMMQDHKMREEEKKKKEKKK